MRRRLAFAVAVAWLATVGATQALPDRPSEFLFDFADLLYPDDETTIRAVCRQLYESRGIELYVVTIPSLPREVDRAFTPRGTGDGIDWYARSLLERWHVKKGILLAVAREQRRAALECIGRVPQRNRAHRELVMSRLMAAFRAGESSPGLVQAVTDMARFARAPESRSEGEPALLQALGIAIVVVLIPLLAGLIVLGGTHDPRRRRARRTRPLATGRASPFSARNRFARPSHESTGGGMAGGF